MDRNFLNLMKTINTQRKDFSSQNNEKQKENHTEVQQQTA